MATIVAASGPIFFSTKDKPVVSFMTIKPFLREFLPSYFHYTSLINLQCFDKCCVGEPKLILHAYFDKYILVIKPLASIRKYKKVIKKSI